MSADSEPELPLPLSPPLSREESDSSSSSSSSSPSRSTNSDIEKHNIPSLLHSDQKEDVESNLDEIPYPAEMEIEADDADIEIPLPPDSSKYSPSQALATADDDMTSPSDSPIETKKVTTTVLGKAQAKKRLLAFSAAKHGSAAATAVKKISPTKASLLQRQQQQQQQQQLAIATIKEEETKMKEILAMNSILNEKLKQVNALTTNIPTQPPATAVVKPTLISTSSAEALSKSAAAVSASVTVSSSGPKEIPPLSSIVISDLIKSVDKDKERRRSTKNLRKARHSTSSSRSRSNSRSRSMSKSNSRSRSVERDRDRERYGKSSKRRGQKSRSVSPSRSKERERGSGRDKDRRGATKKSFRRSQSRSPNREKERSRDREGEKLRTTKEKDRDRERDRHRRKSKSRTRSPDIRVRKRTSKDLEREAREKEREEREREKEKERDREREKEREREERKEAERKIERELDKVRKTRLPTNWTDYRECQYRTSDINFVWNTILGRTRSRSRSNSHSPDRVVDVLNPTPLSRSLTFHSKDVKTIPIEGRNGKADYPFQLTRKTKSKPPLTYGINPFCFNGLYKSRATIFKEEDSDVIEAMNEIINSKSPKESTTASTIVKSREWFAATDQQFCPVDGGKGILISHLYSDDDQSREDSPLPVRTKSLPISQKAKSKLLSSETVGSPSQSPTPNDSENDSDSAPSPLLKRKYNNDDASSFILEKEIPIQKAVEKVKEPERRTHRDGSSEGDIDNSRRRAEEYSSRKSDQGSRRGEETSRRGEDTSRRLETSSRRGDDGSRRVENVPRRSDELLRRDDSSRRNVDSFKGRKDDDILRKGHEIGRRGVETTRRDDEPSRRDAEPYRRSDEGSKRGDDRRVDDSSRKPQEVSSRKLSDTSDRRKFSEPTIIRKLPDVSPPRKFPEKMRGSTELQKSDDKHYRDEAEVLPKTKAKWPEGEVEQSGDEFVDNSVVSASEKPIKKDKKLKKRKKKHHKHKHSKKKHDSSDDEDNAENDGHARQISPSTLTSRRPSVKNSESSKEKVSTGKASKVHRKRKSRADAKGSDDDDSQSSTSEEDDSDDSSKRKPKKKRTKTSDEKVSKDEDIVTSSKDKVSKSEVKRSRVSPPPSGDKVKDKLKHRKKKHDKEKDKKSKKKHSKKTRSTTSPSATSEESDSDDASSKSSSSEEESSGDEASGKSKKKKLKKKNKSPSKKSKGKDKSPPTTDDEKGGGRGGIGRPPGSSGGGSSNSKPERKDTGGDRDRERDRDSGRDRGRDRNQGGGRPRRHNIDDLEEGELTTETSDLEGIGKVKESPYLCFPPAAKNNSQEEEELRQQSINPVNPNPNPLAVETEEVMQTKNLISDSEKETHTLISEFDDDPFLQSILNDEDLDLSAEALLQKISSTNSTDQPSSVEKFESKVSPKKGICTNWSDDSEEEEKNRRARSVSAGPTSGYGTATEKSGDEEIPGEIGENLSIPETQLGEDSDSGSEFSSEPTTVSVTPDLSDIDEKDVTVTKKSSALYDPFADDVGSSSSSYSPSPIRTDLSPTTKELSEINKSDTADPSGKSDAQHESPSKQKPFNFKIGNAAKIEKSKLALFDGDIEEGEIVSESNVEDFRKRFAVTTKPMIPFGPIKTIATVSTSRMKKSEVSSQKLAKSSKTSVEPRSPKSDVRRKSSNRHSSTPPPPGAVVGMPIPTLESGKPAGRHEPDHLYDRRSFSKDSRPRTESRSPSRSYTPPPLHSQGHPRSSPPPQSHFRERDIVRRNPRMSPPLWIRGRRGHHNDPKHGRQEGNIRFFDRHHRRVPRSRSRSPSRSRSHSRSLSRSRSRSRSPRSNRRDLGYEKKRREYLERARRIDSNRHFNHHGGRFAVRMGGRFRHHGLSYRQHHHYDRAARSPPPSGRFEVRRFRRDEQDLLDEELHEEGRRHVEEKEAEKLATIGPGPMTPTGEPPVEMMVKDSPPLQLNVADSTISDSELASATADAGNIICEIETITSVDTNRDFNDSDISKFTPEDNYNNSGPYCSPPRRLSLDERLEMEMGISLRDESPMQSQFTGPPPNYRGEYGFGQHFGMQGKFPPLPTPHTEPPHSDWGGYGHDFKKPGFQGHGFGGEKPSSFGSFDTTHGPSQPPRTQSQIVQVGNVIQVVPAELPSAPITITSTSKTHVYNGPSHLRIGASRQGTDGGVRNRVVTIKVPVLPFTIPMIQPEDMPTQSDDPPVRRRSKPRNLKRRRPEASRQTTKDENVSRVGKGEADVVVESVPKVKDKEETVEPDEIISEEEIALLKEAMSATPGEGEPNERDGLSQKLVSEELEETSVLRSRRRAPYSDDMDEADEGEDTLLDECENGEKAESKNKIQLISSIRQKKIEILPAPSEGILVAAGWNKSGRQRKSVKFADGINPGYGTSPSCGEDMASPPPFSIDNKQKKSSKERSMNKKKKIKVKIVRKGGEGETESIHDRASPPPCPCGPYPFCPPGILYQVCPQYAVLYAQAVAEKGFDIVFEPSTQLPYMIGGAEENSSKQANIPLQELSGSLYLGQYDTHPSNCDLPITQSPHFSPYSNFNYSSQERLGERIPTIMNLQAMNTPPPSMHPLNSLQEQVNAIPLFPSSEQSFNTATNDVLNDSFTMEDDVDIQLPEQGQDQLDEIPLPTDHRNNIYTSPTKIPIPDGTPPISIRHQLSSSTSHSRSHSPEKSKSKKKDKKSGPERKKLQLLRVLESRESISIPLAKIVSNNSLHLHGVRGEFAPINRFADYDFTPYSSNRGLSLPVPVPPPVSLPPGIDLNTPPPGIDLHTPPPGIDLNTPPPGIVLHTPPPTVTSIGSSSRLLSPGASSIPSSDIKFPGKDIVSVLPSSGTGFGHFGPSVGEAVSPSLGLNVPTMAMEELDDTGEETPPPPGTTP